MYSRRSKSVNNNATLNETADFTYQSTNTKASFTTNTATSMKTLKINVSTITI